MLYRAEQLIGRNIEDIVPAHVKKLDFYQRMKTAITRGEHLNGAFRLLRGNGEEAWLRSILQPVKNSGGQIKYFTLHSSDLTRTIETSREHESLIKALMRSTAVIEFNLDGQVLTANDRFLQGMGYSLEQVRGKHHRMFCEPEEANSPATRHSGKSCAAANTLPSASSASTPMAARCGWRPRTTRSSTPTTCCTKWSSSPR
jgi:methyl-accepting chemotaxis protein